MKIYFYKLGNDYLGDTSEDSFTSAWFESARIFTDKEDADHWFSYFGEGFEGAKLFSAELINIVEVYDGI